MKALILIGLLVASSHAPACTQLPNVPTTTNRWWNPSGNCSIGPGGGGWTVYCASGGRQTARPRLVYFSAVPRVIPPTTCTWQAIRSVLLRPVGQGWVYR